MPSVAHILALPALALEPVVTPRPDAEARWVTTSELPNPSQFLEGGEILLTTGLVERSAEDWRLFATRVVDAGVVAIGFGIGLSHPEVPFALSESAADLELNLFVVPRRVPFIAVSRAVADLLWAADREGDRLALQHQRELTSAALAGTDELLIMLATIVQGSALLCSFDGSVIAGHAPASLVERAAPLIRRMSTAAGRSASSEISPGSRLAVHPVGIGVRAEAFLVVESEAPHRVAVTTALALLTLDRERARAERNADRRIRAGALSLALRADIDAARLLLAGSPQQVAFPDSRGRVLRSRGSASSLDDALERIERFPSDSGQPLAAISGDHLVAIIGGSESERATMLRMLEPLETGVGSVRPLSALSHSDDAARLALGAATSARPVVDWSDLVETGVDSLLDSAALNSFATELLDGLVERGDGDELLDALRAFLGNNGQVGPAAASLSVHRNTLRNRLATAETILGRSLHDPQLRADLWIALKQRL